MTDLEKVARMALEVLEQWNTPLYKRGVVITALRQALEQPAQQEPVATDWERIARVQDAKLRAMCDEPGGFEKLREVMNRYERTLPPASKPWVGLTGDEISECWGTGNVVAAVEAKLKEKNA